MEDQAETQEFVIGYQAWTVGRDFRAVWEPERIAQYLLKEDLTWPLSVNWPSAFEDAQIQEPAWTGMPLGLWASLDVLRAFISTAKLPPPYWIVAVTQVGTAEKKHWYREHFEFQPAALSDAWPLLGFDVADDSLLSGLMNCGYWPEERDRLRQRFAGHLNAYHLFDDRAVAQTFRHLTDERVQEHRPFNVFGLYRVAKVEVEGEAAD